MLEFRRALIGLMGLVILGACGGGGSSPASSSATPPSPTPTPGPVVLMSRPFEASPNQYGFSAAGPAAPREGVMEFKATWTPGPPAGQVFLFLLNDQSARQACYDAHDGFACPQVVGRAMGEEHPKVIRQQMKAGERLYIWVVGRAGTVSGTVDISM